MSLLNSVPEIEGRSKRLPHIFSFLTCIFSSNGKKRVETEIGDGRKEEVETQEKICGRACFFYSLLFVIPLKIYASRGENYSTNDIINDLDKIIYRHQHRFYQQSGTRTTARVAPYKRELKGKVPR